MLFFISIQFTKFIKKIKKKKTFGIYFSENLINLEDRFVEDFASIKLFLALEGGIYSFFKKNKKVKIYFNFLKKTI